MILATPSLRVSEHGALLQIVYIPESKAESLSALRAQEEEEGEGEVKEGGLDWRCVRGRRRWRAGKVSEGTLRCVSPCDVREIQTNEKEMGKENGREDLRKKQVRGGPCGKET